MIRWLFVLIVLLCSAVSVEAQVTPAIKQKGNNVGPPGLSNIGVLPCVATAVAPVYTEGFQVGCSTDLAGTMRTTVGGSAGGTSSTFGAAFPATGTASGWSDGTNMQGARVFDLDTGAGTQYVVGSNLRCSAAGGSTECLPATAIDADGIANQTSTYIHGMSYMYNGATWDRVRGTIAGGLLMQVSNATLAVTQSGAWTVGVSNAFVLDATFTGRFAVAYVDADAIANQTTTAIHGQMYGYNGVTWDRLRSTIANGLVVDVSRVQGNVAVTNAGLTNIDVALSTRVAEATFTGRFPAATLDADTIANETTTSIHGKCYLYNGATWDRCRGAVATGLLVNISNATLAVTQSTSPWVANITQFGSNNVVTGVGNSGVGIPRFTMSSDSILASITATVSVQGTKSNNSVAPGATNEGVLPCIANASAPTWIEGNQVGCSTDLSGNGRATTITQSQSAIIQTYVGYTTSSVVLLNTSTIRQTYMILNLASVPMCISLAATSSLNTCVAVINSGSSWITPSTVNYRGTISGRWFSSGIGEAVITDIPGG